ncbi:hypothetical protein MASR2M15_18930 [Anaerolineales bacterium]
MRYRFFISLLLLIGLSACGGLSGEPEIIASVEPMQGTLQVTQSVPDQGIPQKQPNIANGAILFSESCTQCHGEGGQGDGALVLSGEISAPINFTDPQVMNDKTPAQLFQVITDGNIDKLMPPWGTSLSEQERWDLAVYVYSLHYTSQQFEQGAQLFVDQCVRCHGEEGQGDGPDMEASERSSGNLSDHQNMVFLSDQAIYTNIAEGANNMPDFAAELNEEQIKDLVAYTRSLSFTDQIELSKVEGQLSNQTAGGDIPANVKVLLRWGNTEKGFQSTETLSDATGYFKFDQVPIVTGDSYFAVANYQGRNFVSQVIGDIEQEKLDIKVYELTEDPFSIEITSIDMVIEPITIEGMGSGLFISQIYHYKNLSDRAFTTSQGAGNGRFASLLMILPPGAIILNDESDPRYLIARDLEAIISTMPVLPDEDHVFEALYFLPYEEAAVIEQTLNNKFSGEIRIQIAPESLKLEGKGLNFSENVIENDQKYAVYTGTETINTGENFRFEVTGNPNAVPVDVVSSDTLLPIILVIVIIAVVVLIGIVWWSNRHSTKQDQTINRLIRQIAELDQMHETGQINHDVYQRQRASLKAELSQLMQGEKDDD